MCLKVSASEFLHPHKSRNDQCVYTAVSYGRTLTFYLCFATEMEKY